MKISKIAVAAIALSGFMATNSVQASSLSGLLNADDRFEAYLATSNTVRGSLIVEDSESTTDNWTGFTEFNTNLASGQNYFLHIFAENGDNIAGFIGDFKLDDLDSHVFANVAGDLVTTNDTFAWGVNDDHWGDYGSVTKVSGWSGITNPDGTVKGGGGTATQWIWDDNNSDGDTAYFTLAIKAKDAAAVPAPSVLWLLATGLLTFAGMRKKFA